MGGAIDDFFQAVIKVGHVKAAVGGLLGYTQEIPRLVGYGKYVIDDGVVDRIDRINLIACYRGIKHDKQLIQVSCCSILKDSKRHLYDIFISECLFLRIAV